jgi:hypothetical protein
MDSRDTRSQSTLAGILANSSLTFMWYDRHSPVGDLPSYKAAFTMGLLMEVQASTAGPPNRLFLPLSLGLLYYRWHQRSTQLRR